MKHCNKSLINQDKILDNNCYVTFTSKIMLLQKLFKYKNINFINYILFILKNQISLSF